MENNNSDETRDMLYVVGGLALMVLGAGLIASHPTIRRTVRAGLESVLPDLQGSVGSQLGVVVPDVRRYMKIRAM
jgi:hypothetical protein